MKPCPHLLLWGSRGEASGPVPSLALAQKASVPSVRVSSRKCTLTGRKTTWAPWGKMRSWPAGGGAGDADTCGIWPRMTQWPSTLVPWLSALLLQFKFRPYERSQCCGRTEGFRKQRSSQCSDSVSVSAAKHLRDVDCHFLFPATL